MTKLQTKDDNAIKFMHKKEKLDKNKKQFFCNRLLINDSRLFGLDFPYNF